MRPDPLGYIYPAPWNREFRKYYSPEDSDVRIEGDPSDYGDVGPAYSGDFEEVQLAGRVKQPEPGRFIWETNAGDLLYLSEMATRHLLYTLRMLFNHSVPPAFRVGWCPKNRHENVFGWPADYREQAIRKIYHELTAHRTDLDRDLQEELDDMERNATAIVALGI